MDSDGGRSKAWAIAGLLALSLALLIPALASLLLSIKAYTQALGLFGSPWAGFANFRRFFLEEEHARIIGNSVLYGAGGFVIALALGSAIAFFIPRIRTHGARGAALSLLLLPLFVPPVCLAAGILPKAAGNGTLAELYALLTQALLGMSVIGFAGAAHEMVMPGRGFLRGIGWAAFLYAFLLLTPDFLLLAHIMSPENSLSLQVMDTAALGAALPAGEYSYGSAIFTLKAGMQLLTGAAVSVGAYILFLRGRKAPLDSVSKGAREISFWGWFAGVSPLILISIVAFAPWMSWLPGPALPALPEQLLFAAASGLLAFALSVALIGALRRVGYIPFMIFSGALLAFSNPVVGQAFFRHVLGRGMPYPEAMQALLSPVTLVLIILCSRISAAQSMQSRPVALLALLPACYAAARYWGGGLMPFGTALLGSAFWAGAMPVAAYIWTLLPALALGAAGCTALSIYLDQNRISLRALAPEHHQPAQHIVQNDHEPLVEEVGEVRVDEEPADDNVHEDNGEQQRGEA